MLCARCEIDTWWVSEEEALSDVGRRTMCGGEWTGEARTRGARGLVQRKLQRMARGWESAGWKENQAESRVTGFSCAK